MPANEPPALLAPDEIDAALTQALRDVDFASRCRSGETDSRLYALADAHDHLQRAAVQYARKGPGRLHAGRGLRALGDAQRPLDAL